MLKIVNSTCRIDRLALHFIGFVFANNRSLRFLGALTSVGALFFIFRLVNTVKKCYNYICEKQLSEYVYFKYLQGKLNTFFCVTQSYKIYDVKIVNSIL